MLGEDVASSEVIALTSNSQRRKPPEVWRLRAREVTEEVGRIAKFEHVWYRT